MLLDAEPGAWGGCVPSDVEKALLNGGFESLIKADAIAGSPLGVTGWVVSHPGGMDHGMKGACVNK